MSYTDFQQLIDSMLDFACQNFCAAMRLIRCALFFLASSFLVSHPIFYFHTPCGASVPVSLSSPSLPSFPALPSLSTFSTFPCSPPSPISPVPQFPPYLSFLLANDNTSNNAYHYIITERKTWKSYHIWINLLNLLELPLLSTEHYTTSELAYNQKIEWFYRLYQSLWGVWTWMDIAVIDGLPALCETMSLCILTIYWWPLQDMFNPVAKKDDNPCSSSKEDHQCLWVTSTRN